MLAGILNIYGQLTLINLVLKHLTLFEVQKQKQKSPI